MKKLAVLFVLIFFVGCNSAAQLEQQWLGKDKSMLIAANGTPDKMMSDGFGGQVYTYVSYSAYPDTTYGIHCGNSYSWPSYGYGRGYGYHYGHKIRRVGGTTFWIDPYDKIYRVSSNN